MDVYTAGTVGETIQSLIAEGMRDITIDLSMVSRIDSAGLGTLVGNAKSMDSLGGRISLVDPKPQVQRMLEITKLGGYFRILDRMEEVEEEVEVCATGIDPSWRGGN